MKVVCLVNPIAKTPDEDNLTRQAKGRHGQANDGVVVEPGNETAPGVQAKANV